MQYRSSKFPNGKSIYHRSDLTPMGDLASIFRLPRGTKIIDDNNAVTFRYPSGKSYTRYKAGCDSVSRNHSLPAGVKTKNSGKVERYEVPTEGEYRIWKTK